MTAPVRIVIADDHALFRQGLKSLLRSSTDAVVVGEAASLAEVPALLAAPCDVLLLDLQMERSALGDIEALVKRVPVIVVTASDNIEEALAAVRGGARGIVFKRFAVETLMEAIHAVMRGEVWLPGIVQARLAGGVRAKVVSDLTPREREIVRHVGLGLRNAEIAKRLFISEQTVKTHLSNIFPKVGVSDRVELALYAVRVGIVGVHDPD
jgi:two-component system, NarL family, nitrate/nitrite response regulator NarL